MTEILHVRQGKPEDAEACAAILNDWIDRTNWMPRIRRAEDVIRHYREVVFAKRDVHVIGSPACAYIAMDPDEGYITSLYADQPGRGHGKALVDHAKSLFPNLRLWTFVANTLARKFYEREGFVEIDRSTGDNEENLPDVLYEWKAK